MTLKVSVIVPVYNVESYLTKCLATISRQTLREIEIIVVNDGTKDRSRDIVVEAMKKDPRIRLIDQENQGLGYARNTGLDVAQGKYVAFVDSDDWLDIGFLEAFYLEAERAEADIVVGTHYGALSNARRIVVNPLDPSLRYRDVPFHWRNARQVFLLPTPVWDKFYKRELLEKNNIRFIKESCEDIPFKWQVFPLAERISTLPDPFYYYRVRSTSLTGGARVAIDVFRAHDIARKYIRDIGLYDELYPEWLIREINELFYLTDKARGALLSDSFVFNAYFNLLSKVVKDFDFERAWHLIDYIPREYIYRAYHVYHHDDPHSFRNALMRARQSFSDIDGSGVTLNLGKSKIKISYTRTGNQQKGDGVPKEQFAPRFFDYVKSTTCVPERYPDEPRWSPAYVEDFAVHALPPVYDDAMEPAYVSFEVRAPSEVRCFSCILDAYQPGRTVPIKGRIQIFTAQSERPISDSVFDMPVDKRVRFVSIPFPAIEGGQEFEVRLSALRGSPEPAYYTCLRFHSFNME